MKNIGNVEKGIKTHTMWRTKQERSRIALNDKKKGKEERREGIGQKKPGKGGGGR